MVRWGMVIDLDKCTGCQTCSVSCKVENGLGPTIHRVRIIEKEIGKYPSVRRIYIPKRCMNCAEPECIEVCPSGATVQGEDGIVTIDRDTCIGCRYCMMACPYDARMYLAEEQSYHPESSRWEDERYKEHTIGTVEKCDFCKARVDGGVKAGLDPGKDQDASPFCVFSCIANALHFGDLDDPESEISKLIVSRKGYQLLPEMETDPSIYYLPRRY